MGLNLSFDPHGRNVRLIGENEVGKTRSFTSFLWTFFGKDWQDNTKFKIKNIDPVTGNETHHLLHSTEIDCTWNDESLILKRVFKEVYSKKRMKSKMILTGHTTNYYINNVGPKPEKEWNKLIDSIIDADTFKLLTNPMYLAGLHWEKRQEILMNMAGKSVSDKEIIETHERYKDLSNILGKASFTEKRKMCKARIKKINERLNEIPASIRVLKDQIKPILSLDADKINNEILKLEEKIQDIKNDNTLSNLRKEKLELEGDLQKAKNELANATDEKEADIKKKLKDLQSKINKTSEELSKLESHKSNFERKIKDYEFDISDLKKQYYKIAERKYVKTDYDGAELVCPECGYDFHGKDKQKLQVENIEAEKTFNLNRAKDLENNNTEGKRISGLKKDNEEELEKLKKDIELTQRVLEDLKEKEVLLIDSKSVITNQLSDKEREISTQIKIITESLTATETKIKEAMEKRPDTTEIQKQLRQERANLAKIDSIKEIQSSISELDKEEKDLNVEIENIESELNLMSDFIFLKGQMTADIVNPLFEKVEFSFVETQMNGENNPTCLILLNKVPWGQGTSTGQEIEGGLDIIKSFQKYYDIKFPIFIDHAESITKDIETDCQTFYLEAKKGLKELKIEYLD